MERQGNQDKLQFNKESFMSRFISMLKVDFRRMFTMRLFYIMLGVSFIIPILVLVMTTSMDGSVSVDPNTGVETVVEGFKSTWQIVGSPSSELSAGDMSLTAMCNINLVFFMAAVLVSLFISEDFKSGYVKNLFTVRAGKSDYVISKTLVGFICSALMLIAFLIGGILGGAIAGLSFDTGLAGTTGITMSMIAKVFLMGVFVAIFTCMSVIGKAKTWLSMLLSLAVGMLLFTMIPMITPLDSTLMNVGLCLAGGLLFSVGLGAVSNQILKHSSLV